MKKFIIAAVAVMMMATPAFAAQVEVNGKAIAAEAVIVEGRTLVPVRGVFEELGYTVNYDNATKTATLTKGSKVVEMTAGNTYFTVDGKQITPDVPPQIINSRYMLPLRAVSEGIGAQVEWDAATKTAKVNLKQGLTVVEIQDFSDSDAVNEIVID